MVQRTLGIQLLCLSIDGIKTCSVQTTPLYRSTENVQLVCITTSGEWSIKKSVSTAQNTCRPKKKGWRNPPAIQIL